MIAIHKGNDSALDSSVVSRGHREDGPTGFRNISKRNFLRDIEKSSQEVTPKGPEPHLFFLFKISQQIRLLEASKILAEMGCGWQTD